MVNEKTSNDQNIECSARSSDDVCGTSAEYYIHLCR